MLHDPGPRPFIGEKIPDQVQRGRDRSEAIIEMVSQGMTIADACKTLGIHRRTYDMYRKRYPRYAERIEIAKQNGREQREQDYLWDGNFITFRKQFLGFDTYFHQAQILQAIEDTPLMGVTLVLVPPEHGKTSLVEDLCTYWICTDPNIRITQVSEGTGHSRKILGRIKQRLEDPLAHPMMHNYFGPFRPDQMSAKPWSADFMSVVKSDSGERDYTMEARGWKSKISGTRSDRMLIDDLQSASTLSQTEAMMTTLRQDIITRPGQKGKTIIVGTRVGLGDVYDEMMDTELIDKVVSLPATDPNAGPQECPLGDKCDVPDIVHEKPLCPEMWPTHALAKRRKQVTEPVWWRTYQQRPRTEGGETFRKQKVDDAKNPLRSIARMNEGTGIMGVDPALGGGNAIVAAEMTHSHLHVLDVDRRFNLERTEQILAIIDSMAYRYQPRVLVVEEVAFQRGLKNDQRLRDLGKKHGFIIHGHYTHSNKLDDVIGVASMATAFEYNEITMPYADDLSKTRMNPLCEELMAWRPDVPAKRLRQDMVMALWFVWLYWQQHRRHMEREGEPLFRMAGLPYAPTSLWTPGGR